MQMVSHHTDRVDRLGADERCPLMTSSSRSRRPVSNYFLLSNPFSYHNNIKKRRESMQKNDVYRCQVCGNMVEVVSVGGGTLTCCGQPMTLQTENTHRCGG
jgi:desulfoferrodoxin-like iron-binding protein